MIFGESTALSRANKLPRDPVPCGAAQKALRWVRNPTQGPSLRPWEEKVGVRIIVANALDRRRDGRHILNKRRPKALLNASLFDEGSCTNKRPHAVSRHGRA